MRWSMGLAGFVVAVVCVAARGLGNEPAAKEPTDAEIKALIEQLASPNPAPMTFHEDKSVADEYRLPEGFDRKKQEPVRAARRRLIEIGTRAFGLLLEQRDDRRYSITRSSGLSGACFNETVGDVCEDIVYSQLQPYSFWPRGYEDDDPRGKPKRPGYPDEFLGDPKAATKWLEENKEKSLFKLQLAAVDWVIAEEAKRPGDFTDEERAEMMKIREKLVKEGKPIEGGELSIE